MAKVEVDSAEQCHGKKIVDRGSNRDIEKRGITGFLLLLCSRAAGAVGKGIPWCRGLLEIRELSDGCIICRMAIGMGMSHHIDSNARVGAKVAFPDEHVRGCCAILDVAKHGTNQSSPTAQTLFVKTSITMSLKSTPFLVAHPPRDSTLH